MMTDRKAHWVRVELHCHTKASKDSLVPVGRYLKQCRKLGISKIAITDHNQIEEALAAKAITPEMVIVGEEIQTTKGELLGYFMSDRVPPGLTPLETIHRLRDQGAVICIPHPFDPFRSKDWKPGDLEALVPHVDAVETFNARCLGIRPNLEAALFANENDLLQIVGSDAHTLNELGMATLVMPNFNDVESFIEGLSIAEQNTELSPFYVHLFSNYAKFSKLLNRAVNK